MIHDSGSFLTEYLYTSKPVLHTNRDEKISERLNSFGLKCFNKHYHAKSEHDIINFIENVVINEKDSMKEEREFFKNSFLLPPNGRTASMNIYLDIKQDILDIK